MIRPDHVFMRDGSVFRWAQAWKRYIMIRAPFPFVAYKDADGYAREFTS